MFNADLLFVPEFAFEKELWACSVGAGAVSATVGFAGVNVEMREGAVTAAAVCVLGGNAALAEKVVLASLVTVLACALPPAVAVADAAPAVPVAGLVVTKESLRP